MNITVTYLSGQSLIEVHSTAEVHDLFVQSIPLVRSFLENQEMQELACQAKPGMSEGWDKGFRLVEEMGQSFANPLRVTPCQAHLALHLIATVCQVRLIFGEFPGPLIRTLIVLAEIAPCRLPRMVLPGPEKAWGNSTPNAFARKTYERIQAQIGEGVFYLPMVSAYSVFRELLLLEITDPSLIRLRQELEKVTELLHFTLSEITKARLQPPASNGAQNNGRV